MAIPRPTNMSTSLKSRHPSILKLISGPSAPPPLQAGVHQERHPAGGGLPEPPAERRHGHGPVAARPGRAGGPGPRHVQVHPGQRGRPVLPAGHVREGGHDAGGAAP